MYGDGAIEDMGLRCVGALARSERRRCSEGEWSVVWTAFGCCSYAVGVALTGRLGYRCGGAATPGG